MHCYVCCCKNVRSLYSKNRRVCYVNIKWLHSLINSEMLRKNAKVLKLADVSNDLCPLGELLLWIVGFVS